jgi:hypothetical protein
MAVKRINIIYSIECIEVSIRTTINKFVCIAHRKTNFIKKGRVALLMRVQLV